MEDGGSRSDVDCNYWRALRSLARFAREEAVVRTRNKWRLSSQRSSGCQDPKTLREFTCAPPSSIIDPRCSFSMLVLLRRTFHAG